MIGKKYPKILHGAVVNGVQDRQSVYYFANAQFANPEVRMFVYGRGPNRVTETACFDANVQ